MIIDQKYEVTRELGTGSYGNVFLVRSSTQERLALKLLKPVSDEARSQRALENFKNEFAILKDLNHPNIARIFDFGFDAGSKSFYFTSEFVEGIDFLSAVRHAPGVEVIEALFVEVLRALVYLHAHGIYHFDIKSGNVLVTDVSPPKVKLIDFGLASLGTKITVVGTPSYMAPEVILKANPDGRADLYSIGILMYAALTGTNPFFTGDINETMRRQLTLNPPNPTTLKPYLPEGLSNIIMRLLKKNPGERYPSAAMVIRDINFYSSRSYTVETAETVLSYLPSEGRLVGREREWGLIRGMVSNLSESQPVLAILGPRGIGKRRLLKELKYFAQLDGLRTIELARETDAAKEIGAVIADTSIPTVVILPDAGVLMEETEAKSCIRQLISLLRRQRLGPTATRVLIALAATHEEWVGIDLGIEPGLIQTVGLENFTKEEVSGYLCSLTGLECPPQLLVEEIWRRTDGNPLLVTELTKALIRAQVLLDQSGQWSKTTFEDLKIHFDGIYLPKDVEGIFRTFVDGLTPDLKRLLEALGVWGRPVGEYEIRRLVPADELRSQLRLLVGEGVVLHDALTNCYSIRNPMLAEAICDRMEETARTKLHDKIADYLTKLPDASVSELMFHRGYGSDRDAGARELIKLARYLIEKREPLNAIKHLERLPVFYDAQILLAQAYEMIRQYDRACGILKELVKGFPPPLTGGGGGEGDRVNGTALFKLADVPNRLGVTYLKMGRLDEAEREFKEGLKITAGARPMLAKELILKNFLARISLLRNRLQEARTIYQETREIAEVLLSDEERRRVTNNDLAQAYFQLGDYKLASRQLEADLEFFKRINAREQGSRCHYTLAECYRLLKQPEKAKRHLEEAINIAKEVELIELLLRAYNALGNLHMSEKNWAAALESYSRALNLANRLGDDPSAAGILVNMGLIHVERQELDLAHGYFASSIAFLKGAKLLTPLDKGWLYRAHLEMGEIYRLRRQFNEASKHLDEALRVIATTEGLGHFKFWIKLTEARMLLDKGDRDGFKRMLPELEALADDEEKMAKIKVLIKNAHN